MCLGLRRNAGYIFPKARERREAMTQRSLPRNINYAAVNAEKTEAGRQETHISTARGEEEREECARVCLHVLLHAHTQMRTQTPHITHTRTHTLNNLTFVC